MWLLLPLFIINIYYAWRYAPLDIDPDFALFNMAGQTGAWYGRDFADCKSPLVHIWFWLLAKVWPSVYGVRLLHYTIIGLPGVVYAWLTGDYVGGLAFITMIHSGHLLSFHGNVGDMPAGLILLAFIVPNPWVAYGLFVLAVLYEPKLIVAIIPWTILGGYWWQSMTYIAAGLVGLFLIWYLRHDWYEWLVEANITIPRRMNKGRKGVYPFMPSFTAFSLLYVGMWGATAIIGKPNIMYWIPAICYLAFMFLGRVIRPNHLLPLVPWIAAAGLNPAYVIALFSVDTVSAGFYLGDIWIRFYPGLRDIIIETREVGEWIKEKSGLLWVNSMHSEIYIWSGRKPKYGMTEQIEIAQVAAERREKMIIHIAKEQPVWIIAQNNAPIKVDLTGYKVVAQSVFFKIYKRSDT